MVNDIQLTAYQGIEASVNAYIFSDSKETILVDCLRSSKEARQLANLIESRHKPLSRILISHGHPDHYLGMGIISQAFPAAKIVVASPEIKKDIAQFSAWMEQVGWLENEPAMKPKSAANPDGFDYEKNISVLDSPLLSFAGGAELQLKSDYLPSECEHQTTIFCEELNAFLPGDFCYNDVHPWLAVEKNNIDYWKRQLDVFRSDFADKQPQIYPGHGPASSILVFDKMKKYIEDFESTVSASANRAEAMEKMKKLYPDHQQANFLLYYSVNAFLKE